MCSIRTRLRQSAHTGARAGARRARRDREVTTVGAAPIGISACLLGERTRYDGVVIETPPAVAAALAAGTRFVPVCPECESGLGVPRARIALTGTGAKV
ncbi:MAG: DUF523 domain-containing protein, partial [Actinobacteria bacterium]